MSHIPEQQQHGAQTAEDEDTISGHTSLAAASSVAATDSDGSARLEDANMDPADFDFSMEPKPHSSFLEEDKENARVGATSPITVGDESSLESDRGTPKSVSDDGVSTSKRSISGLAEKASNIPPPSTPPPPYEEQARLAKEIMDDQDLVRLQLGQSRFVLSRSWMQRWRAYVGWASMGFATSARRLVQLDTNPPGPIANTDVLESDGFTLAPYQSNNVEDVPRRMWELLSGWYGGTPIERLVVLEYGSPTVELYHLKLKLTRTGGSSVTIPFSRSFTVGDLRTEGITALQMGPPEKCKDLRLFEMSAGGTIKSCELNNDEELLSSVFSMYTVAGSVQFELPGDLDDKADKYKSLYSSTFKTDRWKSDYFNSDRRSATPGAVGLNNLGNTCFMNSAIQCLSHIPQVARYFGELEGQQRFLEDINVDNPLGTKGQLAEAFGHLVKRIWDGKNSCIYPRDFREVLCDHAQQFMGYEQHDSQEFLAYLLDGMHEDVNRVKDKPFVEKVEASSGECDETAARRAWEAHLLRNDSFVVDTMHGQYKSVVTCPAKGCGKTSTTFDPAMYLSVPLPMVSEQRIEMTLATLDGCRPKRYSIWVSKAARVTDLKRSLSNICGKRDDRLVFADVWQYEVHCVYGDDHSVSSIRMDDLCVFELPEWPKPPPPPEKDDDDNDPGKRGESTSEEGLGSGWEKKMATFLVRNVRDKELRKAGEADGRSRLLMEAKIYLARFPNSEELAEATRDQDTEAGGDDLSEVRASAKDRLRRASDFNCPFAELLTSREVEGFREAVQSLRSLVEHEQRDVTVQIIQHRLSEFDPYRISYSNSTPMSFPLLVSYLPHSTTVGDFRRILAVALRRLVLPHDVKREGDVMEVEPAEEGEIKISTTGDCSDAVCDGSGEVGEGIPEGVLRLFRAGELQLLSDDLSTGRAENIFGRGDGLDDDLISNWLKTSTYPMAKLSLRWSDNALREAFDATEARKVDDDRSVQVCRDRVEEVMSVSQCLKHFLQREQLDESEMWYCSNCKEHRRAYKELSLWRLPPVLVIHLKRFSYDTCGGWAASREKIDSLVTFPVRGLDLQDLEHASQARRVGPTKLSVTRKSEDELTSASASSSEDCTMNDWVVVEAQQQQAVSDEAVKGTATAERHGEHETEDDATSADGVLQAVASPGRHSRGKSEAVGEAAPLSHAPASGSEAGRTEGEAMYDLWGVVNHFGGLNGGHYTACARNERDEKWYDFSDDHVTTVRSENDLVTAAAYVLFYIRREPKVSGVGHEGEATVSSCSSSVRA